MLGLVIIVRIEKYIIHDDIQTGLPDFQWNIVK